MTEAEVNRVYTQFIEMQSMYTLAKTQKREIANKKEDSRNWKILLR